MLWSVVSLTCLDIFLEYKKGLLCKYETAGQVLATMRMLISGHVFTCGRVLAFGLAKGWRHWDRVLRKERLRTLSPPPSSAPCEAGEATTCMPSVADVLGVTRRPSVAFSAST